jgi:hypothetical protein
VASTGFDPGSGGTKRGFQGAEQDRAARFFQSLTMSPSDGKGWGVKTTHIVEKYLCFLISRIDGRSRRSLDKSYV